MRMTRGANAFAIMFVALHTLFMWALPIVLFMLVFGWIVGGTMGAVWIMFEIGLIIWAVRERRRRWGHFWPTADDASSPDAPNTNR